MNNELTNKKYRNLREEFWDNFFSPTVSTNTNRMLSTDIEEKEDSYVLSIDVPGMRKDEISIDLEDGYLNVKVEHKVEEDKEDKRLIRHERFYGSYARSFYIGDVDKSKIEAKIDNGVLNIVLPKEKPEEKKNHIEIK